MFTRAKKITAYFLALVVLAYGATRLIVPPLVEKSLNQNLAYTPLVVSDTARALHKKLTIMDWHADTLLWDRDFLARSDYGHIDLPRLVQAGSSIQMLTTVTKTPPNINIDRNEDTGDQVTLLTLIQGWPMRTWSSLLERALYQSQRLEKFVKRSKGQIQWIRSKGDLAKNLTNPDKPFAVLLGAEGAQPLEGKLENLDRLYAAGFRMIGLTHFTDNALGGSLHGISKDGLTDFGRNVIKRLDELEMIIDLSHASEQMAWDVLALSKRPVVVSHTGLKSHCDTPRNFSDDLMKAIASKGGLIGIGMWQDAVCDPSPSGIAGAIKYGIEMLGSEHIALGSDWDGALPMASADVLPQITQALLDQGVAEDDIRRVMGENSIRFLANWLAEN